MRGVLVAVALASLFAIALASPGAFAASVVLKGNSTYTVADTILTVEPINEDGLRYVTQDNRTKLWKKKDCITFDYVRSCLTSASATEVTFAEEFLGAIVKAKSAIGDTTLSLGEETDGTVTLTNDQPLTATAVRVRLIITGPGTFADGTTSLVRDGDVKTEWIIPFTVKTNNTGTVRVTGTVEYFDQNRTQYLTVDPRSVTVTIPFTLVVTYTNTTTMNATSLLATLTRKSSDNLTLTIKAKLPPQARLGVLDRHTSSDGTTIIRRDTLENDSKTNLSGTFYFVAAPSAPLVITVEYQVNKGTKRYYTTEYPFETYETVEPSLGVRIDPSPAGEPVLVRVIITGNTTGALDVSGPYIDDARIASPGTYDLFSRPAPEGNHSMTLNFTWVTPYGDVRSVGGRAVMEVVSARPPEDEEQAPDTSPPPEQPPTITLNTDPEAPKRDAVVWVIGGAAIGCLVGLAYVLHRIREPLHRVEGLLAKTTVLRRKLADQRGQLSPEERERLEALERELSILQKKL